MYRPNHFFIYVVNLCRYEYTTYRMLEASIPLKEAIMQVKKVITILKLLFCAMGNSLIFLLFIFSFSPSRDSLLYDYEPTNIYRIKLLPYFAFALAVFSLILLAQYALLKKHKNFEEIVERKLSIFYLIVCGLGHIAIVPWFDGMEMNVFGFIFFPFVVILSAIIFFYEVAFFFRVKKDKP